MPTPQARLEGMDVTEDLFLKMSLATKQVDQQHLKSVLNLLHNTGLGISFTLGHIQAAYKTHCMRFHTID